MRIDSKIYVAGHRGLVGSALVRELTRQGYSNLVTRTRAELDLRDQKAVSRFFEIENPDYVFMAAAKVGGIFANDTYPAEFIYENLSIQNNLLHHAYLSGVKHLLFLGSSCIYPRDCIQPIKEEYLLTGPLELTNRPYALAKISGIEMCWSYNRQYGTRYICAMPTNLYGPGDNYDLRNSHVLPALIRKIHEAKIGQLPEVVVWGTGTPRREFLYSDDVANACLFLMQNCNLFGDKLFNKEGPPLINIGSGSDLTIRNLAEIVTSVIGFEGRLVFDDAKPDGTPRKLLDISILKKYGWTSSTKLEDGVIKTYKDFLERQHNV